MDYMTCAECGRVFDIYIHEDQAEWHFGHDCEETQ